MSDTPSMSYRTEVRSEDRQAVRATLESTGFFYPEEIGVAVELVEERLQRGESSGYHFEFAEVGGLVAGYTCYGPIACTRASFDLYWIGVHREHRRSGLGRALLARAEEQIRRLGGQRVYVETSSRAQYDPTRRFYLACGSSKRMLALLPKKLFKKRSCGFGIPTKFNIIKQGIAWKYTD